MDATQGTEKEHLILQRILGLKQMLKEEHGGPVEMHELGICYYHLQNFKQAAEHLTDLLDTYPDYVDLARAHALRIFCMVEDEQFLPAQALLAERLKIQASDPQLLGMSAFVEEKLGNAAGAIEIHRRILELDTENVNSLNSLGYLLAVSGDNDSEAYECIKKAISKHPNHPAYLDSFGVFLAKKGQTDNARKALTRALQRAPENSVIMEHLKQLLDL